MNLDAVPEPWKTQMQNRGISSIRHLSRESGLSVETVRKTVNGKRRSTPPTVTALAKALELPEARINSWIGYKGTDTNEPYAPPVESRRLSQRQRTALDELIRSITAKAGDGDVEATSNTRAGVSPAPKAGPTADELEELRRRQKKADETPIEEILGYAAHAPGTESEKQRLDREAAERGEESQDD